MKKQQNKTFITAPAPAKKRVHFKKDVFSVLVFLSLFIFSYCLTGCKKDKDEPAFNKALNKKWLAISQLAAPAWVSPFTGKSYTELFDFVRDAGFTCVLDDYIVFYSNGKSQKFNGTERCDPSEPDKDLEASYGQPADSIILYVPHSTPGGIVTDTIRSKLLELTNDKLVIRFEQNLPFTGTHHAVTETYKAIP